MEAKSCPGSSKLTLITCMLEVNSVIVLQHVRNLAWHCQHNLTPREFFVCFLRDIVVVTQVLVNTFESHLLLVFIFHRE